MQIISLSKKTFQRLEPLKLSREILATEAQVFEYNFRGKEKILKKLNITEGNVFANKLYTLEMLDTNKNYLPRSFCIPDYLCTINGEVCGFTIPKIDGTNLSTILNDSKINYKEQIYYLKKVGEVLQQLEHIRKYTDLKDIYINDLHDSNFMIDNYSKELRVVDLDSCKIGSNDPSTARFLTPFSLSNECKKYKISTDKKCSGYVIANANSDLYCYSIMILNYIFGKHIGSMTPETFYTALSYLKSIDLDENLLEVFRKLLLRTDNENPMPYLDKITEKQLVKARNFATQLK